MPSLDHRRRLQRIEAATAPPVRQLAVLQAFGSNGPNPTDAEIEDQAQAAIKAGPIHSMDGVFVIQLVGVKVPRADSPR